MVGSGCHALHWKMLSWLGLCSCMGFSVFCRWRVARFVGGGCMLGLMRVRVVGGGFGEVHFGSVGFGRRIFLCGFGDAEGDWDCVVAGVW
jgi:hypothetical protein